jgi:hypothetical protein
MAHHKRKKSKRSVRCTICTTHRWSGNTKGRFKRKYEVRKKEATKEIKEK